VCLVKLDTPYGSLCAFCGLCGKTLDDISIMQTIQEMKEAICDIGDRLYKRGFAAANDGNISLRLSDTEVLCTPTLLCKGFLTPEDICLVDMEGKQLAGGKKRSSEVLLHLEIMKARPDVESVVHCHPPHATAFAIAREPIPQGVLPEVEIFLGEVPLAEYETPGSSNFARTILPFVDRANVIVLANHGTVSYDRTIERAYWWTEILDAYCQMLILAKQLGTVHYFSQQKVRELLDIKRQWGFDDPRLGSELKDCDPCGHAVFRDRWAAVGAQQRAFPPPADDDAHGPVASDGARFSSADIEPIVRAIVERVLEELNQRQAAQEPKAPK
jgi:L-fuculose-phosphate aldolase